MMRRQIVALVARREIEERARTRAFIFSTLFLLLVVAGLTVLSTTGGGGSDATIGAAGPELRPSPATTITFAL